MEFGNPQLITDTAIYNNFSAIDNDFSAIDNDFSAIDNNFSIPILTITITNLWVLSKLNFICECICNSWKNEIQLDYTVTLIGIILLS